MFLTSYTGLTFTYHMQEHKALVDDLWYGIPKNVFLVYQNTCPLCLLSTKPSKAEKLTPLKMIISETIGSRAQVDLIDYTQKPDGDYKWVLCYVDHRSGFSYVAPLRNKVSKTVGRELLKNPWHSSHS